jgi:hypothetical protein
VLIGGLLSSCLVVELLENGAHILGPLYSFGNGSLSVLAE